MQWMRKSLLLSTEAYSSSNWFGKWSGLNEFLPPIFRHRSVNKHFLRWSNRRRFPSRPLRIGKHPLAPRLISFRARSKDLQRNQQCGSMSNLSGISSCSKWQMQSGSVWICLTFTDVPILGIPFLANIGARCGMKWHTNWCHKTELTYLVRMGLHFQLQTKRVFFLGPVAETHRTAK